MAGRGEGDTLHSETEGLVPQPCPTLHALFRPLTSPFVSKRPIEAFGFQGFYGL
jgi:hypothetical protein